MSETVNTYFTYFSNATAGEWDAATVPHVDSVIAEISESIPLQDVDGIGWVFTSELNAIQSEQMFRDVVMSIRRKPLGFAWLSPIDLNKEYRFDEKLDARRLRAVAALEAL